MSRTHDEFLADVAAVYIGDRRTDRSAPAG